MWAGVLFSVRSTVTLSGSEFQVPGCGRPIGTRRVESPLQKNICLHPRKSPTVVGDCHPWLQKSVPCLCGRKIFSWARRAVPLRCIALRSLRLGISSQHAAGVGVVEPAVSDRVPAVDEDVLDPLGILPRVVVGGGVDDRFGIEDDEVGLHAGAQ